MKRIWPVFLLALLMIGAIGLSDGAPVDLEAERQSLLNADKARYVSFQNKIDFHSFWADDALLLPDDQPLARGDSITAIEEEWDSLPGFDFVWQPTMARVAKSGDIGYTVGTYELTGEQDGVPMVTVGKYVTIREKQSDGAWKVSVDIFNADGPPAEAGS